MMKRRTLLCIAAFYVSLLVLFWSIWIISGYVFDYVHGSMGKSPMTLDTAIALVALSVATMILAHYLIPLSEDH